MSGDGNRGGASASVLAPILDSTKVDYPGPNCADQGHLARLKKRYTFSTTPLAKPEWSQIGLASNLDHGEPIGISDS
jgi:hypothetical protein